MKQRRSMILGLILLLLTWGGYNGIYADVSVDESKARYADEKSRFVSVRGMNVHYRDEGSGRVLLLLHGTSSSLHTWNGWVSLLKDSFRIIRPDLPGFGLTGADPQKRYTARDYAEFVHDFIEALQIDNALVVGSSLGGNIAYHFASLFPEQVSHLGLIDPSGLPKPDGPPAIFKLARTPVIGNVLSVYTPKFMVRKNLQEVYYNDSLVTDSLADHYHGLLLREGNRQAFIDRVKLEKGEDSRSILQTIQIPTLILWGRNDEWIPVEQADIYDSLLVRSTVVVMDQTGHVPMEEKPEESVSIFMDWLAKAR